MRDKPFRRLAELQQMATRVQTGAQALLIRDCAHKEYDAELRANEGLVGRGNAVLASAGVAISLLMGLVARDAVIKTTGTKALLVIALAFALVSCILSVVGVKFRGDVPVMRDDNVFADPVEVTAESDADEWQRKYLLLLALGYAELRERLFMLRRARGSWLLAAQITFLLFLASVAILALALVL